MTLGLFGLGVPVGDEKRPGPERRNDALGRFKRSREMSQARFLIFQHHHRNEAAGLVFFPAIREQMWAAMRAGLAVKNIFLFDP